MSENIYDQDQSMVEPSETSSSHAESEVVIAGEAVMNGASEELPSAGELDELGEQESSPPEPGEEPQSIPEALGLELVGELRLVGIISPLGAVMAVYLDNPCGDEVYNVLANSNIAVRAVMAQGHIDIMRNVCEAVFGEERFGLLRFSVPFNTVGIELREVSLPAGSRRVLLGLHPAGTVDPRFASREREDGPPRLIRQVERAWSEWIELHEILPYGEDPVWGLVAWPALPYCGNGMEFEIVQELEDDFFN